MGTLAKPRQLAVVTGASSGIGYELAKQFGENGFDLIIAAESEKIQDAARTLASTGAIVDAVKVDLATGEGVLELHRRIQEARRPVEAIAINAGVGVGGDFAEGTSLEAELNLCQLNVVSTVHLAKLVVRDMVARGRGRILFTASIASMLPSPFEAVYGASKAFVLSFSSSLHEELNDKGITVTALLPGPTDTSFFHRAGMDDTKVGAEGKEENDPADVARQGFEALMSGKERVVAASMKTKIEGAAARFVPESVKAKWHRSMSEPGTAKK